MALGCQIYGETGSVDVLSNLCKLCRLDSTAKEVSASLLIENAQARLKRCETVFNVVLGLMFGGEYDDANTDKYDQTLQHASKFVEDWRKEVFDNNFAKRVGDVLRFRSGHPWSAADASQWSEALATLSGVNRKDPLAKAMYSSGGKCTIGSKFRRLG